MKNLILVVEDNGPIRENTTEILELSNYRIITGCNGKEGLDIALEQIPDLILCDIQMPVMDGYLLLELVRKEPALNHSKFIFFTASAERKEIVKGLEMGADDYIVKPFSGEDMLRKVQSVLNPFHYNPR